MSNSSACWLPDGHTNSPPGRWAPCDPTAANSACCATGESCMGSGLCLSSNGLIYRGACTDRTWKDPACATYCSDSSGRDAGPQQDFEFMKPCSAGAPGTPPLGTLLWVCGLNSNCSDPGKTFPLIVGSIRQVNVSGTLQTTPSSFSSSTQKSSSSSTPTQALPTTSATSNSNLISKDECSSSKTTIGAGIGVPLGVLLVMALLWAFWERRKRSKVQHIAEIPWAANVTGYQPAPVEAPVTERIIELPSKAYQHMHPELA